MGTRPNLKVYLQIKQTFLLLIFCFSLPVTAGTFIVDDNYNGSNSSSACEQQAGAQYFSTLTAARIASAGVTAPPAHTIRICPGTYSGNNTFNDNDHIGITIEGTSTNPNHVVINGTGTGSTIFLRKVGSTVRNLTIVGGGFGVRAYPASNSLVDNVFIHSQRYDGILAQNSDNFKITNTTIDSVGRMGVYAPTVTNLSVESSTISNTKSHGIYNRRGGSIIKDIKLSDIYGFGFYLNKSVTLPQNLLIDNVEINNTRYDGIYIRAYDASAATNSVSLNNIAINNAGRYGIWLSVNKNIQLSNIEIDTTVNDAITLHDIDNSSFTNIDIKNAGNDGIYAISSSTANTFKNIHIDNSKAYGIYLNSSDDNSFDGLEISNTIGAYGLYLVNTALNNSFTNFDIHDNIIGIRINNSRDNIFTEGEIYKNTNGIQLLSNARSNQIIKNYIHDNSALGLGIYATGTNTSNSIYQNCFINPATNINNLESGLTNVFDNGSMGNYYGSVPSGSGYSETCVDTNNNGFCDTPYAIPGVSGDSDNFPIKNLSTVNAACVATPIYPNISFKKTVAVVSDPINLTVNPKALPGAVVEYTLKATNSGLGASDNDSVMIADKLPANTRLVFGSPVDPATFIDGLPSSGLNYTFNGLGSNTDNIAFSNNGGASFITPAVDIDGVDASSPPINYIKITPAGSFNPSSASGAPNFSLTYKVKID